MPPEELLIDSSSWIEYLRGTAVGQEVATHLDAPELVTLNLAMAEISYILHRDLDDQEVIDTNLDLIRLISRIVNFTGEEAVKAGKIRAHFEQTEKRQVSYCDCIQIAVAQTRGSKVLSKDRIFKEVPEGLYIGGD